MAWRGLWSTSESLSSGSSDWQCPNYCGARIVLHPQRVGYVKQVQNLIGKVDPDKVKFKDVEANIVRCPDAAAAKRMIA
ncbi:MAG: hypothetical protein RL380_1696, partial [Verrucomicrobiota bacterium]